MPNCRINIFEPGKVLNHKWVILELIGKGVKGWKIPRERNARMKGKE